MDPSVNIVTESDEEGAGLSNDILSMALSPSEENVVCSTRMQQLYNLTLSAADLQGKVGCNLCRLVSVCCKHETPVIYRLIQKPKGQ